MFKRVLECPRPGLARTTRGAFSLTLIFLFIEFFDELHYAVAGATLPSLRADLGLTYAQVGLMLGLPQVTSTLIEPVLMLLGDTRWRRALVLGGGLAIFLSLGLIASAASFPVVLMAVILSFPASGAFVSLSQASLMDLNPDREPQMMARWTVAGSFGNLLGPLCVAGGFALGLGWRWAFAALALLVLVLVLFTWRQPFPRPSIENKNPEDSGHSISEMWGLLRTLWHSIRNPGLLRWIFLLQLADLLMDVFTGYVTLYFTDVAGFTPAQASLSLSVLMVASLAADLILIPLLERIPGRLLVRASAAVAIIVYTAWLLAPWWPVKIVLLVAIRFSTLGWYPVLQGEAYAAMPGRSGTVLAVTSLGGLAGGALTWLIGWLAGSAGLTAALWLLLLGPISLLLFVPRVKDLGPVFGTKD